MSNEKILDDTLEDILKKKSNYKNSRINKQLSNIRNVFYGVLIGSAVFLSVTYFQNTKLKNEAKYKIQNEITHIIESKVKDEDVRNAVYGRVNEYISQNQNIISKTFRSSFDSLVNIFINEFDNELKNYTQQKIDQKSSEWFEEEKNKIPQIENQVLENQILRKNNTNNIQTNIRLINQESNVNSPTQEVYSKKRVNELGSLISNDNFDYLIYADKSLNKIYLYNLNTNQFVSAFNTTDGKGGCGPKQFNGDNKTPEGVYNLTYVKTTTENSYDYNPLFGTVRMGINYPNHYDQIKGRSGNGILICGAGYDYRNKAINDGYDVTYGSVATSNNDIELLLKNINNSLERTVVVIEDSNRKLNLSNYQNELRRE
jgi:murein L,D-transpeptidase YafK